MTTPRFWEKEFIDKFVVDDFIARQDWKVDDVVAVPVAKMHQFIFDVENRARKETLEEVERIVREVIRERLYPDEAFATVLDRIAKLKEKK